MISKSIVIHKLKQKSGKAIQFYDVLYDFCCFFQNHEASCLKCRSLGSLEVPHGIMQDARGNGMVEWGVDGSGQNFKKAHSQLKI